MRSVEYSNYYLPPLHGSKKKPYASRWKMTAKARNAVGIVPGTTVARDEAETEEEEREALMNYPSAGVGGVRLSAKE
jgi:hypothetical protein